MSDAPVTGRKDHWLPKGYLRGFIDPARTNFQKPLWCFQIKREEWWERHPSQIGYSEGFYSLPSGVEGMEHPDVTFSRLENDLPKCRSKLLSDNFATWTNHLEFLLSYMQMIRARSPLFLKQEEENARAALVRKLIRMEPDGDKVRAELGPPLPLTEIEVRTWVMSKMRAEIQKGPDWLNDFKWSLRYTESSHNPVIASETVLALVGPNRHTSVASALKDEATYVCFPICWQACLIGTRLKPDVITRPFDVGELKSIRRAYVDNGREFLISPRKLWDI